MNFNLKTRDTKEQVNGQNNGIRNSFEYDSIITQYKKKSNELFAELEYLAKSKAEYQRVIFKPKEISVARPYHDHHRKQAYMV